MMDYAGFEIVSERRTVSNKSHGARILLSWLQPVTRVLGMTVRLRLVYVSRIWWLRMIRFQHIRGLHMFSSIRLACTPPPCLPYPVRPCLGLRHSGMTSGSASSGEEDLQPANDQIPSQRELEAKIQCAATLLAWSTHTDNAQRLAKVWRTLVCSG